MNMLIIGLIFFLGTHSISVFATSYRNKKVANHGLAWKGVYSLLSILGLVLIAYGYGESRLEPVLLYSTPHWFRHVASLFMLIALILLVATYLPGKITKITKHPQLLAVKIWAFSHLLVNGMLSDVILFGSFLAWAVVTRISLKKREATKMPQAKMSKYNDFIAILLGILLTGAFVMFLHHKLIGVPLIS